MIVRGEHFTNNRSSGAESSTYIVPCQAQREQIVDDRRVMSGLVKRGKKHGGVKLFTGRENIRRRQITSGGIVTGRGLVSGKKNTRLYDSSRNRRRMSMGF